jgi:hypothetical protein
MNMDDKTLPGILAEDIGNCAYGIFKQGSVFVDKTVGVTATIGPAPPWYSLANDRTPFQNVAL